MKDGLDYSEKTCRRCGKTFIVHGEWAYTNKDKNRKKWWCSWSCMRADEKEQGNKAERRERIQQAIRDGLTTNEIVTLLGEDKHNVVYWERKMKDGRETQETDSSMG